MPAADTARLIASLEMDPRKFNAGIRSAQSSITRIDRRLGAFSGAINRNMSRLVDSAITQGTRLMVDSFTNGIESLADLESAINATDGAIRQMGLSGRVTGKQIASWANEIEAQTDAAFDDKDITRNAATLIRYGRVTTANLRPALQVMTDLAAKTGSVDSAASKLAKALSDPTKASRVLREAGVRLTKEQEKYIKGLVKEGKLGKAQAVVLRLVGQATKNAARDANGAFVDMQKELADTREDAEKLFAEGAFPVVQKLGERIRAALGDKETMDSIRGLGQGVASFLDEAITFAEQVPWDSIKSALQVGGQGAKTILDAFKGMPDWVQTAVITGWGLDRLTGGALGSIVGELGKGLIKGVLGMNAAVVNINAGVVKGPGGVPTPGVSPGGPSGGASLPNLGGPGTKLGGTAGIFVADLHAHNEEIASRLERSGTKFGQDAGAAFRAEAAKKSVWDDILISLGLIENRWAQTDPAAVQQSQNDFRSGERESWTQPLTTIGKKQDEARETYGAVGKAMTDSTDRAGLGVAQATRMGTGGTTNAVISQGAATRATIAANRPITNVDIDVNVTSTGVAKATVTANRYGPSDPGYGGPSGKYDKP